MEKRPADEGWEADLADVRPEGSRDPQSMLLLLPRVEAETSDACPQFQS